MCQSVKMLQNVNFGEERNIHLFSSSSDLQVFKMQH